MHLESCFDPHPGRTVQVWINPIPASERTGMPKTRAPVAALVVISVSKDYLSESYPA